MKQRVVARIRRDTDGRSLNQLRRRIPAVLRLWDRDPARVEIVEVLELPTSLKRAISTATAQRREAEEQSRAAQRESERTIKRLQSQLKIGVRDTGELLGISPQYAHKLRHRKQVLNPASPRLPR